MSRDTRLALARGDAGHRARLGRHAAPAAHGRPGGGAGHDAHRQERGRAAGQAPGTGGRMRAAARDGQCRPHAGRFPAARRPSAVLQAADEPRPAAHSVADKAREQVGKRASREHYPAPYAIIDMWQNYGGNALAVPAGQADLARRHRRFGHDAEPGARVLPAGAAQRLRQERRHERRVRAAPCSRDRRRHHGRRRRRLVRAARHERHAAGSERGAHRAGGQAGGADVRQALPRRSSGRRA